MATWLLTVRWRDGKSEKWVWEADGTPTAVIAGFISTMNDEEDRYAEVSGFEIKPYPK